jgi:sugar lactone lactonase YvrE
MKNNIAFMTIFVASLLFGAGCQSSPKETLLMGDFFTGNLVRYENGKMDVIASGFRGADAIEMGEGIIYVSSWPLGKVWSYNLETKEQKVLKGDFTTAADFFFDREAKQLVVPDMLESKLMFLKLNDDGTATLTKTLDAPSKPESVCRGFGGKLYVTMINGNEAGDGGINVIDGGELKEFCRGMNSPKGIAFIGGYLVTADETTMWKVDAHGSVTKLVDAANFPAPIEFLNDVAASKDGISVYVTEMGQPGWMFDPDGERKLWPLNSEKAVSPKKGCVYKVTLEGRVTLAVPAGDDRMLGPNGVTVAP